MYRYAFIWYTVTVCCNITVCYSSRIVDYYCYYSVELYTLQTYPCPGQCFWRVAHSKTAHMCAVYGVVEVDEGPPLPLLWSGGRPSYSTAGKHDMLEGHVFFGNLHNESCKLC